MPSHKETRVVPYTADLMFQIVSDVERYPQFVPWCVGLRILKRESVGPREILLCDTIVGFKGLRERYTSRATLVARDHRIDVEQVDGMFRKLETHWRFTPEGDACCRIDFEIAFEFKSRVLGAIAGGAFGLVLSRMTHAFEDRAKALQKPLQK
ncbi:MAG TPA: type II toxin-antitoxin system RatA family toxin [Rhizomicrobium sp.]|jgi:coenzyme Q-binding protein COQ10